MKLLSPFIYLLFSLSLFSMADFSVPEFSFLEKVTENKDYKQILVTFDENINTTSTEQQTVYTPKKNTKSLMSIDSAINKKLKTKVKILKQSLYKDCTIISDKVTQFNGEIAFIDPLYPQETMVFDQDNIYWDNFIEEKILPIKDLFANEEVFIESIIKVIHENINSIMTNIHANSHSLNCRLFSFSAAPIIYNLLRHHSSPFRGTIQFFCADFYTSKWLRADGGHCWNILSLKKDTKEIVFYLDVVNKTYAKLSWISSPLEIIIHDIEEDSSSVINMKHILSPYIIYSIKRLNLIPNLTQIEENEKALEIASEKILSNVKLEQYYRINLK